MPVSTVQDCSCGGMLCLVSSSFLLYIGGWEGGDSNNPVTDKKIKAWDTVLCKVKTSYSTHVL